VGYFQIFAAFCTGLSLAADTVEFFVVPYILPSAEVELCIEDNEKGWLGKSQPLLHFHVLSKPIRCYVKLFSYRQYHSCWSRVGWIILGWSRGQARQT
jgi:hypothetical protein